MTSYFNACDVTIANSNHKNFYNFFDRHVCAPHVEKGSATPAFASHPVNIREARHSIEWLENTTRLRTSSSPTTASILLEWTCQEQCGSGLTASVPVSDVSAPAYASGVWPLLRLVAQRSKPLVLPPMSNASTSRWSAWPDGSGWRNNRMAA